ncbi:hypothetical protein [Sorangium sp. So ce385]|uniref:hypothetical protein n=1 Tax=Sorangium sp. So ce385 TaxID=3133308 RepID=UPI003F5B689E
MRGRHFYAHLGIDLPLAGSITDTGDIALTRGQPGAPRGPLRGQPPGDEGAEPLLDRR